MTQPQPAYTPAELALVLAEWERLDERLEDPSLGHLCREIDRDAFLGRNSHRLRATLASQAAEIEKLRHRAETLAAAVERGEVPESLKFVLHATAEEAMRPLQKENERLRALLGEAATIMNDKWPLVTASEWPDLVSAFLTRIQAEGVGAACRLSR